MLNVRAAVDVQHTAAIGSPTHKQKVLFAIWTGTYEPKKRAAGAADAAEAAEVASLRTTITALQEAWETGTPPVGWQEAAELIPMQEAQQLVKASGLQALALLILGASTQHWPHINSHQD